MSAATVARNPLVYVAVAVTAVAAFLVLMTATSSPPGNATITGTYDLDASYATAGNCAGAGEYSDIHDGTPVWTFDEPGHPLASSKLILDSQDRSTCHFRFAVVGGGAPVWVQVGDQVKVRVTDPLTLRSGQPRQP